MILPSLVSELQDDYGLRREWWKATKFFISCHPVRTTCTLRHTLTHTHMHTYACTCSRTITTKHPRVPWNLRPCLCMTCAAGGRICVVVSFISVESCRSVACFSHKLPACAAVFWGALCRNAGRVWGWFSGMRRKRFYIVDLCQTNRKKGKNITHFEAHAHTIACPRALKYKWGTGKQENTDAKHRWKSNTCRAALVRKPHIPD